MIEVNNTTKTKVSEAFLKKVVEGVLQKEKIKGKNVSVAIVGAKKAEELNKIYRKKDKIANVLSFPFNFVQDKPAGNDKIPSEVEGYLGEVILCPQQIRKDAAEYGMMFEKALAWMLIHGLLHLLGYDHEQKDEAARMEQKEELYLHMQKIIDY